MVLLAAVLAAVATALLLGGASPRVPTSRPGSPSVWPASSAGGWTRRGVPAAGATIVLGVTVLEGLALVVAAVFLGAALAGSGLAARARARRAAVRRERRTVETCDLLAAELRSGQPPRSALAHCARAWPVLEPVSAAAAMGADVPAALRRVAATPGCGGLAVVADAWEVVDRCGGSLTLAVTTVTDSVRHGQTVRRTVAAELASAQATTRLVAAMPVVVLLLGAGLGGDVWGFLFDTPVGVASLAAGTAFGVAGLAWVDRIAEQATRS